MPHWGMRVPARSIHHSLHLAWYEQEREGAITTFESEG